MAHFAGGMAAWLSHLRGHLAGFTRGDWRAIDERKVCIGEGNGIEDLTKQVGLQEVLPANGMLLFIQRRCPAILMGAVTRDFHVRNARIWRFQHTAWVKIRLMQTFQLFWWMMY